jgi:thiol peroxidase
MKALSANQISGFILVCLLLISVNLYGHCQIPCGIYDDQMRFDMLTEHITTIEKSIKMIVELSKQSEPNMNQLVRWVNNKDYHADEFSHIVTYYFMVQRIKLPTDDDAKAGQEYLDKVSSLHEMLVYAMKTKQTTNLENVDKLRVLLHKFHHMYFGEAEHKHSEKPRGEGKETSMEETREVTMKGKPVTLTGNQVMLGQKAPDFEVVANDMSLVNLASFHGKVCVIATVPSLDTSVCDAETRRFNEEAQRLGDDVVVLTMSMDLPFAQKRWCGAAGIMNVQTLSDYRKASFGRAYGVLIEQLRLLARAVFVVDKEGVIRYIQIVKEVSNEPDYEDVLKAVKEL